MAVVGKTFNNHNIEAVDGANIQNYFLSNNSEDKVGIIKNNDKLLYTQNNNKITFNQNYILIYGRLLEIEENTEIELIQPSNPNETYYGYVIIKVNLGQSDPVNLEIKYNNGSSPNLQNDNLINKENGIYEIALISYQTTSNNITNIKELLNYIEINQLTKNINEIKNIKQEYEKINNEINNTDKNAKNVETEINRQIADIREKYRWKG
ncbi:hypothetical protein [Spiroplasma endosymbiont of Megaselia nigra]|uniref:hypothetical protein n=1 Tax=Spiroplasma endosymbiont of Megaselia nigra TaxID=2478537 RepID=UPI000F87F2A8|nr:hypothetical protein [Spiroplasma endosymbiont of Megaselia nigra]RUO86163.1 hypothetical protein D9R21_04700 [Spiroplasma endosymbiont of Megaselia nigra]